MEPQATNSNDAELVKPQNDNEPHRYECSVCGYVYEPSVGDSKRGIAENTEFTQLPSDWRCPVCTARANKFTDIGIASKPSGFAENLGYGFGVNVLTPGQKNLLIFGSLALAFAVFMSLYALD